MRINPKTYTFDANERSTLLVALDMYLSKKVRTRAQLKGQDEKSRQAIYRNEMEQAKAQDLIKLLGE